MSKRTGIGSMLVLSVLLAACGDRSGPAGEDRVVVFEEPAIPNVELDPALLPDLRQIASGFLDRASQDFDATEQRLQQLGSSVAEFLQTPNESNMEAARDSWLAAHSAYEITALHRYYANTNLGDPQALQFFQLQYRLDHWPILPGYVDYVDGYPDSGIVFDTFVPVEEDSIRGLHGTFDIGEASLGFHVVEFLLWGENLAGVAPRPFSDYLPQSELSVVQRDSGLTVDQLPNNRRRDLLLLTTRLLIADFAVLRSSWNTLVPQFNSAIPGMASAPLLTSLIEAVTSNLTEEFLVQSLYPLLNGNYAEGIHAAFSHSTEATMAAQLSSIENLVLEQAAATGGTLDAMLVTLSDDFAEYFYANFDASKECLVVLYSNLETPEDVQDDPGSEFEIVECINLLTNMIDYMERIRYDINI